MNILLSLWQFLAHRTTTLTSCIPAVMSSAGIYVCNNVNWARPFAFTLSPTIYEFACPHMCYICHMSVTLMWHPNTTRCNVEIIQFLLFNFFLAFSVSLEAQVWVFSWACIMKTLSSMANFQAAFRGSWLQMWMVTGNKNMVCLQLWNWLPVQLLFTVSEMHCSASVFKHYSKWERLFCMKRDIATRVQCCEMFHVNLIILSAILHESATCTCNLATLCTVLPFSFPCFKLLTV
jgi:hypothetical protein